MEIKRKDPGFTLIELVLIIVIMGIVATIAMRSMGPAIDRSRNDATMKEMEILAQAIIGNKDLISEGIRSDFGYVGDIGAPPPDLDALVANPGGYATWDGPYVLNNFIENPNDFKEDAWGNEYSYSGGVVITSSGNGSALTKQFAGSINDLVANTVKGNVYDGLGSAPADSASSVDIIIYYPDGIGGLTSSAVNPSPSGQFSFSGMIPIGNHLIRAVYISTADTISQYITVLPGSVAFGELRFSKSYW
ncbi:MAG: type II secretion system protein [Candidatus Zixiibacteriota bacterium]|nr:MAG: type II secretion system protein [candidate division Zixibacteria bacterium]